MNLIIPHCYLTGLALGLFTFIIIGILHISVIKIEYYCGSKSWYIFLGLTIISAIISLIIQNFFISSLFGILSFALFWSIFEIFKQTKRVKKGWFPKKNKKKH